MISKFGVVAVMPLKMPEIPGVEKPKPSIEHSLIDCKLCDQQCWIGPTQLRLVRQNPNVVKVLCYLCVYRLDLANGPFHALDPHADEKPRRT